MLQQDKQLFARLVCALTANPNVFHISTALHEHDRQQQRREILREACALVRTFNDFVKDENVNDYLDPSRVMEREMCARERARSEAKPGQR